MLTFVVRIRQSHQTLFWTQKQQKLAGLVVIKELSQPRTFGWLVKPTAAFTVRLGTVQSMPSCQAEITVACQTSIRHRGAERLSHRCTPERCLLQARFQLRQRTL